MKRRKNILIFFSLIIVFFFIILQIYQTETRRLHTYKDNNAIPLPKILQDTAPKNYDSTVLQQKIKSSNIEDQKQEKLEYKIIKERGLKNIKYSVTVRLLKKISYEQISQIAWDIKGKINQDYEKIFIEYYLPHMEINSGAWARSLFNPGLTTEILGLSIEEEDNLLKKQHIYGSNELIGRWIDELPTMPYIIELYQDNQRIYMRRIHRDGSSGTKEMKLHLVQGQKRYVDALGNDFGEYYAVESNGNLSAYDDQGKIFTAIKK